jgi:hypothetical protein
MTTNSLYPSTLFHFTKKERLFQILKETFKVSYARERITAPNSDRQFAVPMVAFCDIKLAEIKYFIEKGYGNYGIGLTKDWANKNGLNPVMYVNRHCDLADKLTNGLNSIYFHISKMNNWDDLKKMTKSYHNIMNIYRYVKNYEGELKRNGKLVDKNYRFADEREWRFVPPIETTGVEPFVAISNILTQQQKDEYNRKVSHISLNFEPDDIKYLFVEKEDDISELIEHLDHAKSKFTDDIRRKLASRIITVEQIQNDF